ncbi:MAG: hypothetical protein JWN38_10 [Candidatus Saccharibacteria bacterium]|nr:hypothetical protein [Candidatus Saccharibacteria bacterium]
MSESFDFPTRIPENSDAFKEWQQRHETGQPDAPSEAIAPQEPLVLDVPITIPEDSDAFKEWQRRHSEDSADTANS